MSGPTNPVALSFSAPTKYTDGTNIPANGIVKYQYGFGTTPGSYSRIIDDSDFTPSSGKQAGVIPSDLAEGQWYASARSVSAGGGVSAWGNEVPFFVQRVPVAIADLAIG